MMKLFSAGSPCVKCGTTAPYSEFKRKIAHSAGGVNLVISEYITRRCRHCKYEWNEHTKDHVEHKED